MEESYVGTLILSVVKMVLGKYIQLPLPLESVAA